MNWSNPFNTAYNVPNTLILSSLAVFLIWLLWKFVKIKKIKIDKHLAFSIAPWVFLTSSIRVLKDLDILSSQLFVSPWLYLLMSGISFLIFLFFYEMLGKDYWMFYFLAGFLSFLFATSFIPLKINVFFLERFFFSFSVWLLISYLLFFLRIVSKNGFFVLLSQMYDANITFVSIRYLSFISKHVLPTAIIIIGGPISFALFKFVLTLSLIWTIERKVKDKNFRNYLELIMALPALLTGTRDLLRILSFS